MKRCSRSLSSASCGRQNLERDAAVEAYVLSEIHLAHPALAEGGHDLVVPQLGALVQE